MSTEGVVADAVSAGVVDPDALVAELFTSQARELVRLARLFCDDRDAAEDLVQEAFIRLHRSAGTIRDRNRAPAFLRSIVINLARDHNRRGLMSLRHQQPVPGPPAGPSAEDVAAGDDEDRAVLAALGRLSDRQRACLVMRYYLGLSESEIAETLGVSGNSVKTHCRRGLTRLELALEEQR